MIKEIIAALLVGTSAANSLDAPATDQLEVLEYDYEEIVCLADNMYWEARNQSTKGMLAVGHVTMNRVFDDRFPYTVCEVVEQGPTRPSWKDPEVYYPIRHRCQFSWYCDGKSDIIPTQDEDLYNVIMALAFKVYFDDDNDFTEGATHYHADYVSPSWASTKTKTVTIGDHIFYRWEDPYAAYN